MLKNWVVRSVKQKFFEMDKLMVFRRDKKVIKCGLRRQEDWLEMVKLLSFRTGILLGWLFEFIGARFILFWKL